MPVQKIVIQVTVLCATETLGEATEAYHNMDLGEIKDAITDGDDIGGLKFISAETLTDPEVVKQELLAIGNDGEFFDMELGLLTDDDLNRADA